MSNDTPDNTADTVKSPDQVESHSKVNQTPGSEQESGPEAALERLIPETPPETLIDYPVQISVKAMGLNEEDFESLVASTVRPLIEPAEIEYTTRPSSEGKYVSVRVHFVATSHEHLLSIYAALKAEKRVLFTL